MEITLKQAYDIFIADRETSCADETISYYKENLTNFFKSGARHPASDGRCTNYEAQALF